MLYRVSVWFGFMVIAMVPAYVMAQQGPNLSAEQERQIQAELDRRERLEQDRQEAAPTPEKPDIRIDPKTQQGIQPSNNPNCLQVNQVTIENYQIVEDRPPFGYDRLEGQCATEDDIRLLLSDINRYYQEQGYITTRVYIDPKALKQQTMRLVVKPGIAAGFSYANEDLVDNRLLTAFPIDQGDVINLRNLEQGLENFNAVPSQSGQFKLYPGQKSGESIITVDAKREARWRASQNTNNSGFDNTGVSKIGIDLAYDNITGFNDILTVGWTSNAEGFDEKKLSRSATISYRLFRENSTFDLSIGYQRYRFLIQGVNQQFPISGNGTNITAGWQRLISRDKSNKHYTFLKFKNKRSANFNAGFEIVSQQRRVATLEFGWQAKHFISQSRIDWQISAVGAIKGLGWDKPEGATFDYPFLLYKASLSYNTPLSADNKNWLLSSRLVGQYTEDELPGSEQFSIGGRYNVRGFHIDNLGGAGGVYWRNELEYTLPKYMDNKVSFYGGIDAGWLDESTNRNLSQTNLVGVAFGIRMQHFNNVAVDLTYAKAIDRPTQFNDDKEQLYFNLNLSM